MSGQFIKHSEIKKGRISSTPSYLYLDTLCSYCQEYSDSGGNTFKYSIKACLSESGSSVP